MKIAAIISVGTEIMKGRIDDTNSTFISRYLNELGIDVKYRISVQDLIEDIIEAIKFVEESDIIILTGGLGPTDDDLTREAVSAFLGKELVFDEEMWENIQEIFKKRNFPIPLSNKKQAMKIRGGEFIPNSRGTAPGLFYNNGKILFFLLPGPPRENQIMVKEFLEAKLYQCGFINHNIYTKVIRVYNIGEGQLAEYVSSLSLTSEIGYYFTPAGWVEIHLTKKGNEVDLNRKIVEEEMNKVLSLLEEKSIFWTPDLPLSSILLEKLLQKGLTISFAESMTGGAVSSELVKNSGASKVFLGGVVTYSNELKKSLLNVSSETLDKYGAVSEEVAIEMVSGLKNSINSDIAVSITGIAGPNGATESKPVGLTYIGFFIDGKSYVKREVFMGDRERIIKRCTNFIFTELILNL